MKYVVCRIGLLAAVVSFVSPLPARAAEPPRVVISEINWGGSARSTADEWIELANIGESSVDVGGWVVSGVASSGGAISLAAGTQLAAGDALLVANYAMSDSSTLAIAPDLVTTAVSLANHALNILLILPDGTVVDSAIDAGDLEFGSSQTFASMERDLITMSWHTATESVNLLDEQLGSPGSIDVSVAVTETSQVTGEEIPEAITEEAVVPDELTQEVPTTSAEATTETSAEEPEVTMEETSEIVEGTPVIVNVPIEETPTTVTEGAPTEAPIDEPEPIFVEPVIENPVVEEIPVDEPVVTEPEIPAENEEEVIERAIEEPPINTPVEYVPAESVFIAPESAIPRIGKVLLSEFVSSPTEGEEWIEVVNADAITIDVTGWTVADASGKTTVLPSATLAPGEYLVVMKPLGKLNNDGDTITLRNSTNDIVDTVIYTKDNAPGASESLGWDGDAWTLSAALTPNATNSFPAVEIVTTEIIDVTSAEEIYADSNTESPEGSDVPTDALNSKDVTAINNGTAPEKVTIVANAAAPAAKSTNSSAAKKSSSASSKTSARKVTAPSFRTVTSLDGVAIDEHVEYTGTLIALPGTFGNQVAVLDGAMLYMYSAEWPALQLGDVVHVTGIISESRGEKRIKVAADALTVTGHVDLIAAPLANSYSPALVNVVGRILGRESDTLTIDMDGKTVTVRAVDNSGVTWSGLTTARIAVTGVVRTINGERILMPRTVDDVQFLQEETISAAPSSPTPINARPWVGAGLLTSSGGALGYWFLRSRRLTPITS